MFFPDVAKATAEFARVLKPGGRLCSSVWVKPEENPWTTVVMQAIATEAVVAPPDRDGPNMFRCAAPGYVSALYEGAGLRDIAEWDVEVELVTRSPRRAPSGRQLVWHIEYPRLVPGAVPLARWKNSPATPPPQDGT